MDTPSLFEGDCKSSKCDQIMNRMISALIFYSTINPLNNTKHESKFIQFCNETYSELLDDYIHVMDKHQNDIDQINDRMKTDLDLMRECHTEYKNCALLLRHYRNREKENVDLSPSSSYSYSLSFYIDLLDTIHCFWYHSFHLGLRARTNSNEITRQRSNHRFENNRFNVETNTVQYTKPGTVYFLQ